MYKRYLFTLTALVLVGIFIRSRLPDYQVGGQMTVGAVADENRYLPIIMKPLPTSTPSPTPTPIPLPLGSKVKNRSFENGWTDLPPVSGWLTNQQPNEWVLTWIEPGELLFDSSSDTAGGIPECIHKHSNQLPPNEQIGGEDALILDGDYVYKIFHFGAPFGAELTQTISGLTPGAYMQLVVPIQVHLHGAPDPYSAESGVWVNGQGDWANGSMMGDRTWYEHIVNFQVPANGKADVVIRMKSKWYAPIDFFIDFLH